MITLSIVFLFFLQMLSGIGIVEMFSKGKSLIINESLANLGEVFFGAETRPVSFSFTTTTTTQKGLVIMVRSGMSQQNTWRKGKAFGQVHTGIPTPFNPYQRSAAPKSIHQH